MTPGDSVVQEFLDLAGLLSGESDTGIGAGRLTELIGILLLEFPEESFATYLVYRGSGHFRGSPVTALLRAPRRRDRGTPLLLTLELTEPLALSRSWLLAQGQPDATEPPSPHVANAPEFIGFRRGNVLASVGIVDDRVTMLVLQDPG